MIFWLRYLVVAGLECLCGMIDKIPARRDGRWTPSQWGCWPLRLATLSGWLEGRWQTGAWKSRNLTEEEIDTLMDADHRVYQWNDGRDHWECSCGRSGSTSEGDGDLHSDRHIKPGESRVDTNRPLS